MAAAAIANIDLIVTRKFLPFHFLMHITVFMLMINMKTTYSAFNTEISYHRASLNTVLHQTKDSMNIHRNRFEKSTTNSNIIAMKVTSVDQNEDVTFRPFHRSRPEFWSEQNISLPSNHINGVEMWYFDRLEEWYSYTEHHIKCPFFRRRFGDVLDNIEGFVRFFLIRPYFNISSSHLGPPISSRSLPAWGHKTKHLPVEEILNILRKDWRAKKKNGNHHDKSIFETASPVNEKGYYVTGKMSTRVYRDDCEFLSPDPDLPLKGLRKYIGVTSNLFDSKTSNSKLLFLKELHIQDKDVYNEEGRNECIVLKAEWRISLTIKLPWKPKLSEFSGSTLYFLDEENLIYRHQETWGISVVDAFLDMMSISKNYNNNFNSNNNHRCPLSVFSQKKSA